MAVLGRYLLPREVGGQYGVQPAGVAVLHKVGERGYHIAVGQHLGRLCAEVVNAQHRAGGQAAEPLGAGGLLRYVLGSEHHHLVKVVRRHVGRYAPRLPKPVARPLYGPQHGGLAVAHRATQHQPRLFATGPQGARHLGHSLCGARVGLHGVAATGAAHYHLGRV